MLGQTEAGGDNCQILFHGCMADNGGGAMCGRRPRSVETILTNRLFSFLFFFVSFFPSRAAAVARCQNAVTLSRLDWGWDQLEQLPSQAWGRSIIIRVEMLERASQPQPASLVHWLWQTRLFRASSRLAGCELAG